MRLLLHFSRRVIGGGEVLSCKYCPWLSQAEMAAETAPVLCQQKQAKDWTLSSSQMWDDLGTMYRDESPMLQLVVRAKLFEEVAH